jgi:uncharacterized protein
MEWYQQWQQRRDQVKTRNKKLVARIAKSNSRKVNAQAEEIHERVFDRIDCLKCANCCTSIPPMVNETDVRRISKHLGIKTSKFKEQYLKIDEDQDMVMNQSPCDFLGEGNKCDIYDVRPKACRQYPHTDNYEFTKHLKLHLTNTRYCPAVFHILEEMQNMY